MCTVCNSEFSIKYGALNDIMKGVGGQKHKDLSKQKSSMPSLKNFFGYVQKRMGKTLLDKVNECKGKVYTLDKKKIKGIGGAGKLTKAAIKRIRGHYEGKIRKNVNNLEKMKKAIYAIWFHRKREHTACGSWCGWF